jgi:regulator of ribonuclease activity A
MPFPTTDLCDRYAEGARVADPVFRDFGGLPAFAGTVSTVKVFEDNVLVRQALSEPGAGRVLVVDGGGSLRCALLGDQVAELAVKNGWIGVVVYGCVRDTAVLTTLPLGVKALAAHPSKSVKRGEGVRDVEVRFGGIPFRPGDFLAADADGIVVLQAPPSEGPAGPP